MTDTLFRQNVLVLLGTTFAALLLSLLLVAFLIIRPEAEHSANAAADILDALGASLARLDAAERVAVLQILDGQQHLSVKVASAPPEDNGASPGLFGRFFLRALEARHSLAAGAAWRLDGDGWFWMRLPGDDPPIWVSIRTPPSDDPIRTLLLVSAVALFAGLLGGLALQRRVARPLEALEARVGEVGTLRALPGLDETGPREIAAVSRAINRMTARLRQAEADRAVMLAGVSHDLRTPLTKLRLSLALMHGADADLVEGAQRQVVRIETMLAQFLDHARGFAEEATTGVCVAELLRRAVDEAGAAGRVEIACPPGLTARVRRQTLTRAIGNLVTNALVHGAPPVRISARIEGGDLVLEVADGGTGLDPADAEALVRPFARGDSARTGEGTGLGLTIAEQAAAAHDGSLRFSRAAGGFTATIRVPRPDGSAAADARPAGNRALSASGRVEGRRPGSGSA